VDKEKMDPEERDLLESYEHGEWQPVKNFEAEAKRYREYARATLNMLVDA
jgi:hypothetical protein